MTLLPNIRRSDHQMVEPRRCSRCRRSSCNLFATADGSLRCTSCLRYAGLAAEPDPAEAAAPAFRAPVYLDMRAGPCQPCQEGDDDPPYSMREGGQAPGGALRGEDEPKHG
jgi:hypothetical protein